MDDRQTSRSSEVMTTQELAEYLRVHITTILRLANIGEIPGAFKVGALWRFHVEKIDDWIASDSN